MNGLPTIFNQYKVSVGRVHDVTGTEPVLRGTCFLVAPLLALTCHHIVFNANKVIEKIRITFEGRLSQPVTGIVYLGNGNIDIALLMLTEEMFLPPLPISLHEAWGEPFHTFGYPLEHGGGVTEDGTILGPTSTDSGAKRLELRAEPNRILQGFSGGPVFVSTPDDRGYCIGCIIETGSQMYPDVASCVPLSSLIAAYPKTRSLFSEIITPATGGLESTLQELSNQPQPAALWKVTQQLVNKEELTSHLPSGNVDITSVANKVYEAVRENLGAARQSDEASVRDLSVIINGLRIKYQQLRIDLRSLSAAALKLQATITDSDSAPTGTYPPLLPEAEIVSDDLQRIPTSLLNFARLHGASISYAVLQGSSYQRISHLKLYARVWAHLDNRDGLPYIYENIARLFEAAVSLIELDLTALSRGYLDDGWVSDVDPNRLSRLVTVGHRDAQPAILVYEQQNDTGLKPIARLVARKHNLGKLAVRREDEDLSVYASGGQYVYQWSLSAATPIDEFNIGDDDSTDIRSLHFGDRASARDLFITTVSNKILHQVDGKREECIQQKADIVWNNPNDDGFYTAIMDTSFPHSIISNKIVNCRTTKSTAVSSVQLNEIFSDVISFEGLRRGSPSRKQPQLRLAGRLQLNEAGFYEITLNELLGSRCLVLLAGLELYETGVVGSTVFFLDPYTLQPIRTPVLTTLNIMNCRLVHYQHSWLLIASLIYGSAEFNPKVAVWDESNIASRECPAIIGAWHEDGFDARYLNVTSTRGLCEAYYLLTRRYSEDKSLPEEIWKFMWPQKTVEKVLTLPSGFATGLSIWHA